MAVFLPYTYSHNAEPEIAPATRIRGEARRGKGKGAFRLVLELREGAAEDEDRPPHFYYRHDVPVVSGSGPLIKTARHSYDVLSGPVRADRVGNIVAGLPAKAVARRSPGGEKF